MPHNDKHATVPLLNPRQVAIAIRNTQARVASGELFQEEADGIINTLIARGLPTEPRKRLQNRLRLLPTDEQEAIDDGATAIAKIFADVNKRGRKGLEAISVNEFNELIEDAQ